MTLIINSKACLMLWKSVWWRTEDKNITHIMISIKKLRRHVDSVGSGLCIFLFVFFVTMHNLSLSEQFHCRHVLLNVERMWQQKSSSIWENWANYISSKIDQLAIKWANVKKFKDYPWGAKMLWPTITLFLPANCKVRNCLTKVKTCNFRLYH